MLLVACCSRPAARCVAHVWEGCSEGGAGPCSNCGHTRRSPPEAHTNLLPERPRLLSSTTWEFRARQLRPAEIPNPREGGPLYPREVDSALARASGLDVPESPHTMWESRDRQLRPAETPNPREGGPLNLKEAVSAVARASVLDAPASPPALGRQTREEGTLPLGPRNR